MKPIKLKFTAFGPYPTTQTIDFTTLKNSNMFVITGPTGSGKTTIFDAISFALYGSASGSDRKVEMFRSDFAPDNIETVVEFEFQVRDKTYSVKRTPAQYRPKLRGEGMRKIESSVTLITDDGVYTAQSEVSSKIESILGLTKDQFKQIVLLPQGEFKKLLMSDSGSKEEIFRKIFNTSELKQIQEKMRVESQGLKRMIEDAQLQINTVLNNYSHITTSAGLQRLAANVSSNLKNVNGHCTQIEQQINATNELLAADLTFQKQKTTLNDYRGQLEVMNNNREKFELATNFLNNLKPTIEYKNYTSEQNRIEEAIKQNDKQIESYQQQLTKINSSSTEDEYRLAKKEFDSLEQKHTFKLEIEKQLIAIKDQKQKRQTIENYHVKVNEAKEQVNQLRTEQVRLEKKRADAATNLQHVEQLQVKANELEIEKVQLEKMVNVVAEIANINKQLEADYQQAKELNANFEQANRKLVSYRESFINSQAGTLAQTLVHHQPCPVCGSLDHPHPASEQENQIKRSDIEQQEKIVAKINSKLTELTRSIDLNQALVVNRIAEYQVTDCDYNQQFETVSNELNMFQQQISTLINTNSLEKIETQLVSCKEQISTMNSEIQGYQFTIDKLSLELTLTDNQLQAEPEIEMQLTTLSDEIKHITSNYNQLQAKFNQQVRTIDNLHTNIELLNQSQTANQYQLVKIRTNLQFLIDTYSSELLEKYCSMLKDEQQIRTELAAQVQREQTLIHQITELETLIANYQPIDVDALKLELSVFIREQQQYDQILEQYKVMEATIENDLKQLRVIENKNKDNIKRYQLIADVSDIANGKTLSKISFERYMLSIYFKQIIARANIYFKTMTNNRFLLEYKEPRGGRALQGLDLNIIDNYTSKIRDVKSLSGGESFKASLAMALGLSDIVQMNSGGVQIDTIFIDEGFGSLDSDSLNTAIDTLIEIENEGRMVGIISHVEELKTQISNKIEIESSPSGSSLNVNFS